MTTSPLFLGLESRLGQCHQPAMAYGIAANARIYFRYRRHSGYDRTCYRLDPVANDPKRSPRPANTMTLANRPPRQ
jgi:hypothetical protein